MPGYPEAFCPSFLPFSPRASVSAERSKTEQSTIKVLFSARSVGDRFAFGVAAHHSGRKYTFVKYDDFHLRLSVFFHAFAPLGPCGACLHKLLIFYTQRQLPYVGYQRNISKFQSFFRSAAPIAPAKAQDGNTNSLSVFHAFTYFGIIIN